MQGERILHVLAPAKFGGLERVVQMLASGQVARGHEVHVAAILDAGAVEEHPFPGLLAGIGVRVHRLGIPPRAYLRERRAVDALLRELRPAVAHLHGYRPDVLQSGVAARRGVPRVSTVHGFTGGGLKNRVYETLQRRAFRKMDGVVAVSRRLEGELAESGVPADRLHCIPNAWAGSDDPLDRAAARERLGVPAAGQRIGFVGRLSREKGADVLVEALGRLSDLPVAASFVGAGRQQAVLEARTAELGLEGRVTWHGAVPDAGRLLLAFDALILSSRTEGTPIVLLEAMSAGVPVVATRVGGVPDVVSDREAVLVEPERPDQLAVAIRAVLDDPGAAAEMAQRARTRLETEYGLAEWVARYDAVYERARRSAEERG